MQRKVAFAPEEYYHIYNRGARKHAIFTDSYDRSRFLYLLFYSQAPIPITNIGHYVSRLDKTGKVNNRGKTLENILKNKMVELVCFILMDNHFHLIVKELKENGISRYMQKVMTGYTKYANVKYNHSGHAFQGRFRSVHISSNEQLLYTSAYIHRNIAEDKKWKNKEHEYPWSSYQDYVSENRWGKLLEQNIILSQFKNPTEYHDWTQKSGAKEFEDPFVD